MKKIIFNAMIIDDMPSGLGIYARNVLKHIDDNKIAYVISKISIKCNIKNVIIKLNNKNKILSVFLRSHKFNNYVRKNRDYSHVFYSPTQHGINIKGIKQIITIHDVTPLIYPHGRIHQYIYYKYILPGIMKKCEKIIAVSNNTKNDIKKHYNIEDTKIEVIYDGFDKPNKVCVDESKKYIKNKYNIENYILLIGIHYKYKNLHSVIKAYSKIQKKIDEKIVIVGNYNVKYGKELMELVKENNLEDKVMFLGYVNDDDKNKLYQASKVFIYPSLYEGFGLPILEAMANQTPVLCSNTSSLPEVGGSAAEMFNPNDINKLSEKILYMCKLSNEERQTYIDNGIENIKRFSWEKSASEIEKVIEQI